MGRRFHGFVAMAGPWSFRDLFRRSLERSLGRSFGVFAGVLLAGTPALSGCAGAGTSPKYLEGGAEIGLQRGSGWSTLTVKPPHVVGPRGNLNLQDGVISGRIDGRTLRLEVDENSVQGIGPMGQVAVEVSESPTQWEASGMWNGSRVRLEVSDEGIQGTIAVHNGGTVARVQNCQYKLNRVDPASGARIGSSICNGMPAQTRMEVPAAASRYLTRTELMVVLMTLISVPPPTINEMYGRI